MNVIQLVKHTRDTVYSLVFEVAQLLFPIIILFSSALFYLGLGFALLRYRSWDSDAVINRTLVYVMLTISLVLIYVGLVIGLGALLRLLTGQLGQSSVVIVISTLAIAALFQPLRQRIQAIIDRRFYRRKYDAARTLEAFSATLRTETELGHLSEQLVAVVEETMQLTHVSFWSRPTAPARKPSAWMRCRIEQPGHQTLFCGLNLGHACACSCNRADPQTKTEHNESRKEGM